MRRVRGAECEYGRLSASERWVGWTIFAVAGIEFFQALIRG
jgi:hypothetical protein